MLEDSGRHPRAPVQTLSIRQLPFPLLLRAQVSHLGPDRLERLRRIPAAKQRHLDVLSLLLVGWRGRQMLSIATRKLVQYRPIICRFSD